MSGNLSKMFVKTTKIHFLVLFFIFFSWANVNRIEHVNMWPMNWLLLILWSVSNVFHSVCNFWIEVLCCLNTKSFRPNQKNKLWTFFWDINKYVQCIQAQIISNFHRWLEIFFLLFLRSFVNGNYIFRWQIIFNAITKTGYEKYLNIYMNSEEYSVLEL